jgi:probable rRNA maturation factor
VISITITNRQKSLRLDRRRVRSAVRAVLHDAQVKAARLSVAFVDDATIAKLHGQFLNDPTPTDVLSFLLQSAPSELEGEIIISAETARANAVRYRATPEDELIRYVIHGVLHLVGYGDGTPQQRAVMRKRERQYLLSLVSSRRND